MPLSEDEQRILQEIEEQLYESDPALAREVGSTTLYSHAFRNLKWATAAFAGGVVFMIVTLSASYLYAFGGFVVMLVSALFFQDNARKLGRAGLQQVTQSMRAAGLRDYMGTTRERVRDRFKRPEDD